MRKWLALLTFVLLSGFAWLSVAAAPSPPASPSPEDELLRDATRVFEQAIGTPASAIPPSVMLRARGVLIVPAARRDGALYYGVGVFSAREGVIEEWSPPAVLAFQGAIPLELESPMVDFILLPMSPRGLNSLLQERFAAPIANPVVPGALGQDGRGQKADIVGYIRFAEYCAGVTIDDWEISALTSGNMQLYGRPYTTEDIVRGAGFFHVPKAGRRFRETLTDYFRNMS
jgi:lipid-binding SYLF domain-containing protein